MKKLFFALMSIFILSSSAFALTEDEVLAQKDVYAFNVLAKASFAKVVGDALLSEITANTGTSSPSKVVDNRFLVISGCEPHNCGSHVAAIFIDSKNPSAVLIVRTQTFDSLAKNEDQKNVTFIRNNEWSEKVDESQFPELKKKVLSLQ